MIPAEAVEAAARAIYEGSSYLNKWDERVTDADREEYRADARIALEAAAPYLMAQAWAEGWEAGLLDIQVEFNPYDPHKPTDNMRGRDERQ